MENNQPLVSVITPSYNQGQYIEETLRSVLRQDYPNIEYIVIDGGSTDDSVSVIEKYKDKLAYFVSEKDNGQSDAINKGFKKATGEIIAWLNSDDVYTENAVSRAVTALQKNPEAGFVFGNVLSMDMNSSVFNTMKFGNWGLWELMCFKIISQPGIFMRKESLHAVDYLEPEYDYLMDHHLWLKIAAKYPVKYVNEFWAAARYHPQAKNRMGGAHYGEEAFLLLEWMKSQPEMQNLLKMDIRLAEAGAYQFSAHYLLDSGEDWKAFKSYCKAIIRDVSIFTTIKNRMAFALLNSIIPADTLRKSYLDRRTNAVKAQHFDHLLDYIN